jgi:para-nitrobenzyl esterase
MRYQRKLSWLSLMLLLTVAVTGVSVLAAGLLTGCSRGTASLSRVQLDSGPIKGIREADLWVFKGIPYAAPPVGELRWRPPQPVAPWKNVRVCDAFGPSCPQPGAGGVFYLEVGPTAEDCLYLNVWSPARSASERLPVMVWIHGGSFETGSGSMAVYGGAALAAKGVVVVTLNYRLGPLGFLAHPALTAESPEHSSGNYGLLDQIAALQWVKRNIAAFGGDPERVTVFGESAGAISILDLLVSPLAEGLFERAIAQSGILLDVGFGVSTNGTLAEAERSGEEFAKRLGIDPAGDVAAQLRAKSPGELLSASSNENLMERGLTWKPVADGYVLPDLPTRLWLQDKQTKVPLLIGSNADEGNAFLTGLTMSAEEFRRQMEGVFGPFVDQAYALYPVKTSSDIVPAFSRMLTEVGFASTARFAAQVMSRSAPAYLYQFTRVPLGNPLGAFHGVEIPYVFGNAGLFTTLGPIEQVDYDLSEAMMGYWTRFAASGDPNGAGAVEWPRYDSAGDQHLELGDVIRVGSGLYKEACDLADQVRRAAR